MVFLVYQLIWNSFLVFPVCSDSTGEGLDTMFSGIHLIAVSAVFRKKSFYRGNSFFNKLRF